jgi:formamidopyrimidine-DNA glycosylase
MPELPEVETIKGQLNKKIRDKKIKTVEIKFAKMLVGVTADNFKKIVEGRKIKGIERRAKLLIINLSNNYSLVIHLKMTGQILVFRTIKEWESYKNKSSAHLIYYFEGDGLVVHSDTRKFGYVKLVKTTDLESLFQKESFGPEPLAKDFNLKKFKNLLTQKPRAKIKPLLMDQTFLAGVGNIYAQEACWAAKIFPTRSVQSLSQQEVRALYVNLIKILCLAVSHRGSSVDNYLDTAGQPGEYVPRLKVYNREGEKCYRDDGIIKKMTLGGRGTYYCPKCQI